MITRIDTDLLIPGRATPIEDAAVILDGESITYAGPRSDMPRNAPDSTT